MNPECLGPGEGGSSAESVAGLMVSSGAEKAFFLKCSANSELWCSGPSPMVVGSIDPQL